MSNIIIAESDIRQALEGIECPSVQKKALKNELLSGYLDFVVEQLIVHGVAEDVTQAIKFLVQDKMFNQKQGKVTLGDIDRSSSNNELYKKIDSKRGQERKNGTTDLTRAFGTRGHSSIPKLFCGELNLKFARKEKPSRVNTAEQKEFVFGSEDTHHLNGHKSGHQNENTSERIALKHVRDIKKLWYKVVSTMKADMFPMYKKEYLLLLEKLRLVFGSELDDLKKVGQKNAQAEYLFFLSVLTWTTTLEYYQSFGTKVLFREVSLFPYHYDVSLGRIDALELVLIRGEVPNRKEVELLKKLASVRYDSIGHIMWVMIQQFGKGLTLKVHDWKFAVGDGDNGIGKTLNLIHSEDIKSTPLLKHRRQMERYLSSAYVSYEALVNRHMHKKVSSWETADFEISGTLHYFFPDREPIVYDVVMSSDEKRESFGKIAASYSDAQYRRKFLSVSRSWLKFGLALSEGGSTFSKQARFAQQTLPGIIETTSIAQSIHTTGKVSSILQGSVVRNFVDEFEIVESAGKDKEGKDLFRIHLDKILEGIDAGTIIADPDPRRNGRGSIRCPVHQEKTASFHISLSKRIGKCFGCGVGGKILESSIPSDITMPHVVSNRSFNRGVRQVLNLVIPERHQEIMKVAQKLLQRHFFDSPAVAYLEEQRKLNAEVAHYRRGAGYGSLKVVSGLLEEGFSYDELIFYGFLGVSEKIKTITPLVSLLQDQGMSFSEIQKSIPSVKKGESDSVGLPFFYLDNKLTFPLEIGGVINNMYGRSLDLDCPKKFRHIKLSSEYTNIPHGGFNMHESFRKELSKKHPMLIIDEAPLNVETFIQISNDNPSVIGLVGVNNDALFELLADFPGDLLVALNNDEPEFDANGEQLFDKFGKPKGMTGQKNTVTLAQKMRNLGFQGAILNFTKPFVRNYPQVRYNDINQFWTEYGQKNGERIKALSHLETIRELPDSHWGPEEMKEYWKRNFPVKPRM